MVLTRNFGVLKKILPNSLLTFNIDNKDGVSRYILYICFNNIKFHCFYECMYKLLKLR